MDYEKAWKELRDFMEQGIDYMNELRQSDKKEVYDVVLSRMKDLEMG